tara:strand:+ start:36 stop:269 length:234 start_codon:yes stop_codon:yes gene_type:complete
MWTYQRRLTLTDRDMTIFFKGYALRIRANGQLLSKVNDKLETLLKSDPLWVHSPIEKKNDILVEELPKKKKRNKRTK